VQSVGCFSAGTLRADKGGAHPPGMLFSCIPSGTLRADEGRLEAKPKFFLLHMYISFEGIPYG